MIDSNQRGYLKYHKLIGLLIAIGLLFFGIGINVLSFITEPTIQPGQTHEQAKQGQFIQAGVISLLFLISGIYQVFQVKKIWNKKIIGWKDKQPNSREVKE